MKHCLFSPFWAPLVVAIFLPACTHKSLTTQAMSFNKTVQEHRVEQLFMNVLRAANREPMTITAVTALSTSRNNKVSLGPTSWAFGPLAAVGLYRSQATISAQDNPNMGLSILDDDKEFMEGFMKPITIQQIKYFYDQGWRPRVLAYLLVERIELEDGSFLENEPRDHGKFEEFRGIIEGVEQIEFIPCRTEEGETQEFHIKIDDYEQADITIRSPEGVLYYLGELARIQLDTGEYYGPLVDDEPIFNVARLGKGSNLNARVKVAYRGGVYVIPDAGGSRSMQSLALIQQLINLQHKKITPPSTPIQLIAN